MVEHHPLQRSQGSSLLRELEENESSEAVAETVKSTGVDEDDDDLALPIPEEPESKEQEEDLDEGQGKEGDFIPPVYEPEPQPDSLKEEPADQQQAAEEEEKEEDQEPEVRSKSLLPQDEEEEPQGQEAKLIWYGKDYGMLALILLSFVYLYYYFNEKTDDPSFMGIFFAIIIGSGVAAGMVARLSVTRTFPFLEILANRLQGPFHYALIHSAYAKPHSLGGHLLSALRWCFFPTLTVFFFLAYAAELYPSGGALVAEGFNPFYVFLFVLPVFGMALAAPLRVLANSSLVRYSLQERTMEPFGSVLYRLLRAIGGMGALTAFLKVALAKSGVEVAIMDTFMILMFVLPTMFIATLVYSFWHLDFVKRLDALWWEFGYQEYRLTETGSGGTIGISPLNRKNNAQHQEPGTTSMDSDEEAAADQEEHSDDQYQEMWEERENYQPSEPANAGTQDQEPPKAPEPPGQPLPPPPPLPPQLLKRQEPGPMEELPEVESKAVEDVPSEEEDEVERLLAKPRYKAPAPAPEPEPSYEEDEIESLLGKKKGKRRW